MLIRTYRPALAILLGPRHPISQLPSLCTSYIMPAVGNQTTTMAPTTRTASGKGTSWTDNTLNFIMIPIGIAVLLFLSISAFYCHSMRKKLIRRLERQKIREMRRAAKNAMQGTCSTVSNGKTTNVNHFQAKHNNSFTRIQSPVNKTFERERTFTRTKSGRKITTKSKNEHDAHQALNGSLSPDLLASYEQQIQDRLDKEETEAKRALVFETRSKSKIPVRTPRDSKLSNGDYRNGDTVDRGNEDASSTLNSTGSTGSLRRGFKTKKLKRVGSAKRSSHKLSRLGNQTVPQTKDRRKWSIPDTTPNGKASNERTSLRLPPLEQIRSAKTA